MALPSIEFPTLPQLQEIIARGDNLNLLNKLGQTYLHDAVNLGHIRAIQLLLNHGAKVNARNVDGLTPLAFSTTVEVAQLLLDNQASVNLVGKNAGPLHAACATENLDLILFLVEMVDDINQPTLQHGKTPLHVACEKNLCDVISILLNHGADVARRDSRQNTPLTYATSLKAISLLLERGADVNAVGNTTGPLHFACRLGNMEAVKLMLTVSSQPVDVTLQTLQTRRTPFHEACLKQHAGIIKLLLQSCLDKGVLYAEDISKKTPYQLATYEIKELFNLYYYGSQASLNHIGRASKRQKANAKKTYDRAREADNDDDDSDDSPSQYQSMLNVRHDSTMQVQNQITSTNRRLTEIESNTNLLANMSLLPNARDNQALSDTVKESMERLKQLEQNKKEMDALIREEQKSRSHFQEQFTQNRDIVSEKLRTMDCQLQQFSNSMNDLLRRSNLTDELQHQFRKLDNLVKRQSSVYKQEMEMYSKVSEEKQTIRLQAHEDMIKEKYMLSQEIKVQIDEMAKTSLSTEMRDQVENTIAIVESLQVDKKVVDDKMEQLVKSFFRAQSKSEAFQNECNERMTTIQCETNAMKNRMIELNDNVEDMKRKGSLTKDVEKTIGHLKQQMTECVVKHELDNEERHQKLLQSVSRQELMLTNDRLVAKKQKTEQQHEIAVLRAIVEEQKREMEKSREEQQERINELAADFALQLKSLELRIILNANNQAEYNATFEERIEARLEDFCKQTANKRRCRFRLLSCLGHGKEAKEQEGSRRRGKRKTNQSDSPLDE